MIETAIQYTHDSPKKLACFDALPPTKWARNTCRDQVTGGVCGNRVDECMRGEPCYCAATCGFCKGHSSKARKEHRKHRQRDSEQGDTKVPTATDLTEVNFEMPVG